MLMEFKGKKLLGFNIAIQRQWLSKRRKSEKHAGMPNSPTLARTTSALTTGLSASLEKVSTGKCKDKMCRQYHERP